MDINGKRVIVTGAASGIGKALAAEFKNEGAAGVVLADISESVKDTAQELGYEGFVIDVSKEEEIKSLIAFTNETLGGLDIF